MTELEALIRQMIEREGPMSVAHYMQLALQHPTHGYYIKGDPLGIAGDFTTAPETSQMFGELIGLWCAEVWSRMGKPSSFVLLELGPGRGTLMQDALRATKKIEGFHAAMKLMLLETNETLIAKQMDKLGAFNPSYLANLHDLPDLPLLVIGNEFLDALPIHQYIRTPEGWRERKIGLEGGALAFVCCDMSVSLPLPDEANFFEVSPLAVSFVQHIATHIAQHNGGCLLIDYGDCVNACHDTLQAVSGHSMVSVLEKAGSVDLTAHVDFAALCLAAEKQGVRILGCITQSEFLKAMGIELRTWQLKLHAGLDGAHELDAALERLIGLEQMGGLFKAFAFVAPTVEDVPGFP